MNLNLDNLTLDKIAAKPKAVKNQVQKIKFNKEKFLPISGAISLICIILISLGVYAQTYQNKIYPGIKVAGINLGGMTKNEAEQILVEKIEDLEGQKITAEIADKKIETDLTKMGIDHDAAELTEKAYQIGHTKDWISNIKELANLTYQHKNLDLAYNLSQKQWNAFLGQLSEQIEQKADDPHFEIQEGQIKIILGQPGITIETEKLKEEIFAKVESGELEKITVPIIKTQIVVPDDQATAIIAQAENYTQPISFTFESRTFGAQKENILAWLVLVREGENFRIEISNDAIAGFVAGLASRINTRAKDTQAMPSGQVISEGTPGQALNSSAAISQIKQVLSGSGSRQIALQVSPVEPGIKTIYPAGTPGLFDGKYIEIVLSKQTLYAFESTNLVSSFAISSGLPATPTPQGMFSVYSKSRSVLMAGPGYYLPGVEWVNRFSGPYSIHGTYWHSNFGHPMSHGCVNATNGNAAFIYGWAPIGTPVYVHY